MYPVMMNKIIVSGSLHVSKVNALFGEGVCIYFVIALIVILEEVVLHFSILAILLLF